MNSKLLKGLSMLVTVAGAGLTILTAFVDDKKQDEKITEGINKALAEREEKES